MAAGTKPYKGVGMEGAIARWYAKNTGRDRTRFVKTADTVCARVPAGSRVLEIAPGPGFCAIEIARTGRYEVTGLDISESFVRMARDNAAAARVQVDFRHGNASQMPFSDTTFDYILCTAAFKNFSHPVGALNEMHRVLKPGGLASIIDLRKDVTPEAVAREVQNMRLTTFNAWLTRQTFRFTLLKRAYTRAEVETLVAESAFGACDIALDGIGFEVRLARHRQTSDAHKGTAA
jgi:ubiquinone/menaquinone biosynthesis C-methylase UbiE